MKDPKEEDENQQTGKSGGADPKASPNQNANNDDDSSQDDSAYTEGEVEFADGEGTQLEEEFDHQKSDDEEAKQTGL